MTGDAQILDRGYRRFDGDRAGVAAAVRSVAWHTTRGMLGLGRKFRFKIVPLLIILIGFLPAVGFAAFAIIVSTIGGGAGEVFGDEIVPEYWELAPQSIPSIVLFIALMAPDAIVRDRKDGMVSLYLTTPLTISTYMLAKFLAVIGVLAIIVLFPTLLFLLALTFAEAGPDGFADWIVVLVRIVGSGLAACVIYAAISMAASSLSDRRSFATAIVILAFFGTATTVSIMIDVGDASETWQMFNPVVMPLELIARVFGGRGEFPDVSTANVYAANVGWVAAASGVLWWRYKDAGV